VDNTKKNMATPPWWKKNKTILTTKNTARQSHNQKALSLTEAQRARRKTNNFSLLFVYDFNFQQIKLNFMR